MSRLMGTGVRIRPLFFLSVGLVLGYLSALISWNNVLLWMPGNRNISNLFNSSTVLKGRIGYNMDPALEIASNTEVDATRNAFLRRFRQCVSHKGDVCAYKRVRVFCWIFTTADNLETRARFQAKSWVRHCDAHVFFVCRSDPAKLNTEVARSLNVVHLSTVEEKRSTLYTKTLRALDWMTEQKLFDKYDWFLKADDDTFTLVEHFKELVRDVDPNSPQYVGRLFNKHVKRGFMSGGAGFAISRSAMRLFNERYKAECPDVPMPCDCDDMIIGRCFEKWNVPILESRDESGKQRYFPIQPELEFAEHPNEQSRWQLDYDMYPTVFGANCCSDTSIAFHYVRGSAQSMFYHFAYKLPPRRLQSDKDHSSLLIANCIHYALDDSVALNAVNISNTNFNIRQLPHLARNRSADSSQTTQRTVVHSSPWSDVSIDGDLLFELLALDASFCDYANITN